jgi:ribosomal-protein-alanine N-acetyltransferase
MRTVDLVRAGPAHAELVAALHAATMPPEDAAGAAKWNGDWVARILALPGAAAVVALAPDPVGFAVCLPAGSACDLLAIGVLPEHRRAGVARLLLTRCEVDARAAGAERLMLEVAEDNVAARALYRAAGFTEIGRRRAYYAPKSGGGARDALVLSKNL